MHYIFAELTINIKSIPGTSWEFCEFRCSAWRDEPEESVSTFDSNCWGTGSARGETSSWRVSDESAVIRVELRGAASELPSSSNELWERLGASKWDASISRSEEGIGSESVGGDGAKKAAAVGSERCSELRDEGALKEASCEADDDPEIARFSRRISPWAHSTCLRAFCLFFVNTFRHNLQVYLLPLPLKYL